MDTIVNKNYNPMQIANYIVEYCNENGIKLNNLKLQKILYFLQARFLVEENTSLFSEKLEKWKYGPVLPSVYHEYKSYGAYDIDDKKSIIRFAREGETPTLLGKYVTEEYNPDSISETDKNIIDNTLEKLKNYDPFNLVRITHRHNIWSNYKESILNSSVFRDFSSASTYSDKEIKEFFEQNPEEQLWKN